MQYKIKIKFEGEAVVFVEAEDKKLATKYAYQKFIEHDIFNEEYTSISIKTVK